MTQSDLHALLHAIAKGTLSVENALKNPLFQTTSACSTATNTSEEHVEHQANHKLVQNQTQGLESSITDTLCGLTLDTSRKARTGLGEVVFAPNKSPAQLISAVENLSHSGPVLVTRAQESQLRLLQESFPEGSSDVEARLFSLGKSLPCPPSLEKPWNTHGPIVVISAGGADRPVALEAYGALHFWGITAGFIADVGVAGLHRLTPHVPALQSAKLIIAVAGMEGALPGIVAGFVSCPVVAVPTSVGYGVGAEGRAALTSMLCSCVPGIAVCNIDNGFGAAAFAAKSLLQIPST